MNKRTVKNTKISSSGRFIKTPKNLLTTSSDEEPIRKKISLVQDVNLAARREQLRAILQTTKLSTKKEPCEKRDMTYSVQTVTSLSSLVEGSKKEQNSAEATKNDENSMQLLTHKVNKVGEMLHALTETVVQNHRETVKLNENLIQQNKLLIEQNSQLQAVMTEMRRQLQSQENAATTSINKSFLQPLEGFPLSKSEDIQRLEKEENVEERKKLLQHLKKIGASKLRQFVKMSIKEIFTDKFLTDSVTWNGVNNTFSLSDSKTANIIFSAAKECIFFHGPESKNELKTEIVDILRITKQRHRKRVKEVQTSATAAITQDDESSDDENKAAREIQEMEEELNTLGYTNY